MCGNHVRQLCPTPCTCAARRIRFGGSERMVQSTAPPLVDKGKSLMSTLRVRARMNIFDNFKLLKADMEEKGWVIEAFSFNFKKIDYVVLVKLYQSHEVKEDEWALLKVEFLKAHDINDNLVVEANVQKLLIDTRTLREYFGIEWSENLGDIVRQFYEHFAQFIPDKVDLSKSDLFKKAMNKSLSESDSEDPNKIYCYSVRRNPDNETRSIFNDNKSRLLRPKLYEKFMADNTVSFCYSPSKEKNKSDDEIISNFSKKK